MNRMKFCYSVKYHMDIFYCSKSTTTHQSPCGVVQLQYASWDPILKISPARTQKAEGGGGGGGRKNLFGPSANQLLEPKTTRLTQNIEPTKRRLKVASGCFGSQ